MRESQARSVRCPKCGAEIGKCCRTATGISRSAACADRVKAAEQQKAEPCTERR